MTDDEVRAIGRKFIDSRRQLLRDNPWELDPTTIALANARWDFIDPLRMGLYVLTKSPAGTWVVDFDHIQQVCANPSAFKQAPSAYSARVGDMSTATAPDTRLVTLSGEPADCVTPESLTKH